MTRIHSAALLCLAIWTSGCVTIVRGDTATVAVDADRDSAYVFVDGVPAGITPARLEMRRRQSHTVEVVREGYRPEVASVEREFNPAIGAAAFLGGGLNGVLIDVATGAIYDLDPGRLTFTLTPDSSAGDAVRVAQMVRQAQVAAETGFAEADPNRRRPAPWLTFQSAGGGFVGTTSDSESDAQETSGGIAFGLAVGARTESATARVRVIAASDPFGGSSRWDVSGLLGLITETSDGRFRLGLAAGPGVSGGTAGTCAFFCDTADRSERERLPTRVGVAAEADAFLFITQQFGLGVQVPVNVRLNDTAAGVLLGFRFEGL